MASQKSESIDVAFPSIPGSELRRATCSVCQQPMRITLTRARDLLRASRRGESFEQALLKPVCSDCDGKAPPSVCETITPRQRHHLGRTSS
jgi:hypothetical protein